MVLELIAAAGEGGMSVGACVALVVIFSSRKKLATVLGLILALKGPGRFDKVMKVLEIIHGTASKESEDQREPSND